MTLTGPHFFVNVQTCEPNIVFILEVRHFVSHALKRTENYT